MDITGRVAVVTGGASGIGRSLSLALVAHGMRRLQDRLSGRV